MRTGRWAFGAICRVVTACLVCSARGRCCLVSNVFFWSTCVFDPSPQTSVDKGRSCPPWQSVAERARLVNDRHLNDIASFRKAPS